MLTKTFATLAVVTIIGAALTAQVPPTQTPQAPAAPRPATAPQGRGEQPTPARNEQTPRPERAPEPPGQPVNIKLELTITDQPGPGEPTKKTITMIVSDRQSGSIRSRGNVRVAGRPEGVTINVDARPVLLRDGMIKVDLGLEYQPRGGGESSPQAPTASGANVPPLEASSSNLNQRIGLILESGKPLVISQAADPASDRRITVELKATVLK